MGRFMNDGLNFERICRSGISVGADMDIAETSRHQPASCTESLRGSAEVPTIWITLKTKRTHITADALIISPHVRDKAVVDISTIRRVEELTENTLVCWSHSCPTGRE